MPIRLSTKPIAAVAILAALWLFSGCDRAKESPDRPAPVGRLESKQTTFERRGSNCNGDGNCPSVSITREVFDQRPALNKAVLRQLMLQLQGNGEDQTSASNLEEVADNFLAEAAQVGEISSAPWQLTGEAKRLARRGDLLTVEISSYLYSGGAHGMPSVHWLNWDLATDEGVSLNQVIREGAETEFWAAAQSAHRRWLDKQEGVDLEFRKFWPFQRSKDFRLDEKGVELLYGVYELAPYAFGSVQLTVPWEDLHGVVRDRYLP